MPSIGSNYYKDSRHSTDHCVL